MRILLAVLFLVSSFSAFASDRAYFEQFLYRRDNTSNDPDFPKYSYRYLGSDYHAKIPMADGKKLMPRVSLLLFKDGTYFMKYNEMIMQPNGSFFPGKCKTFNGKWDVAGGELLIDDLAAGVKHYMHNQNAAKITFKKNIHSEVLKGFPIGFTMIFGNADPRNFPCFPF